MTSPVLHRVRKFILCLFPRVHLCCIKDGARGEGDCDTAGVVADIRSEEMDQGGVIGRLLGKNVSMEFILEMREAFQMFDKGPFIYDSHTDILDFFSLPFCLRISAASPPRHVKDPSIGGSPCTQWPLICSVESV